MILITHDLAVVSKNTDRLLVMYAGKIVESGETMDVIRKPAHPYTDGLLKSIPRFFEDKARLNQIPGMVPSMFNLPKGCKFEPRCPNAKEICREQEPLIEAIGGGREIACFYPIGERN